MWFLDPARTDHLRGDLGRVTPEPADAVACGKTLMRHFPPPAFAVPSLPLRVPPRAHGGLLVAASREPKRCPPLLLCALRPAVQVAPVTSTAQDDEPPAPPAQKSAKASLVLVDGVAVSPRPPALLPLDRRSTLTTSIVA
jgi:hypothetical protein